MRAAAGAAADAIKIRSKETERMFGIRVETSLHIQVEGREARERGGIWLCLSLSMQ